MFERKHRIITLVSNIICLIVSIFGIVISFIELFKLSSKSGVFEAVLMIIANIFMFGIALYGLVSTIMSFKKGSTFMKELMLTPRLDKKTKSFYVFLILGIISTGLSILIILILTDVIYNDVFPKALDSALLSFLVLLMSLGYTFSSYPYFIKLDKRSKGNEKRN